MKRSLINKIYLNKMYLHDKFEKYSKKRYKLKCFLYRSSW